MKKEVFEKIKEEWKYIAAILAIIAVVLKIAFYRESLAVTARASFAIGWMFVVPGYFLMLHWSSRVGFLERIVIGAILSAGIMGILSYYLGILSVNTSLHVLILPILLIASGLFFGLKSAHVEKI